ncbi:MAG TPA: hypothetical protein VNJ04_04500 [Gemmatimonadaceae bacterium]|nr:hypothetical protein [Gemmatimonadaceae bacterium]
MRSVRPALTNARLWLCAAFFLAAFPPAGAQKPTGPTLSNIGVGCLLMTIDPVGQLSGFGSCSTPRSIGFRFTYSGRRSGIPSRASQSKDFTWAAPG